MAEQRPPHADLHPMRVLFVIPKAEQPLLSASGSFSKSFRDFVACCTQKDPSKRPSAAELLQHPFLKVRTLHEPPSLGRRWQSHRSQSSLAAGWQQCRDSLSRHGLCTFMCHRVDLRGMTNRARMQVSSPPKELKRMVADAAARRSSGDKQPEADSGTVRVDPRGTVGPSWDFPERTGGDSEAWTWNLPSGVGGADSGTVRTRPQTLNEQLPPQVRDTLDSAYVDLRACRYASCASLHCFMFYQVAVVSLQRFWRSTSLLLTRVCDASRQTCIIGDMNSPRSAVHTH